MHHLESLAALEARVHEELSLLDYPARPWVPRRWHGDGTVLDVLIVGAGQGGLATAFGLLRERIDNVLVVDRAPPGAEGPWTSFARMLTLRTPKHVSGPDLGVPSLTPRAWYQARFGAAAWAGLDKIGRELWQEYLIWYRRVLDLPVRNGVALTRIVPEAGLLRAEFDGMATLHTRKIVLATGIEGSGAWHVPAFIREGLPRERWSHTADKLDSASLRGQRIGVLGAGASAFDNAAVALEAGAEAVTLCVRRARIPRVNPYRWMESAGFLGQFAALPDLARWRFQRQIFTMNQPPPPDTVRRCTRFATFALRPGTPWLDAAMRDGAIEVRTPQGPLEFDHLIIGTGFRIDPAARPELADFADAIANWGDRFAPPPGEADPVLASYPYLDPGFAFTERVPGTAPFLADIHNFTFGATISMGLSGASISGMKFGVRRLVDALARDLFLADADRHLADLLAYDTEELTADVLP